MAANNLILRICNARKNILDILEYSQKYNVTDYKYFSINEIDTMFTNDQLDMLIEHKDNGKKTYIKFHVNTKILRTTIIDNIVNDLFVDESILNTSDNLLIIILDEPNDSMMNHISHIYKNKGIYIALHNIDRLQYNILEHDLVPEMTILNDNEVETLKKEKNISELKQLPEISRFDPQALAMSMRPGNVGKFKRKSYTALEYDYYRLCV